MIKGTTTQFKFHIPCDFEKLKSITITFWQENYYGPAENRPLPIVKVKEQCYTSTSPQEVCVKLNTEETLRFAEDRKAYVQFRAIGPEDEGYATKQKAITVYPMKDDSLIGDIGIPTPGFNGLIILDGMSIEEDGV